MKNEVKVVLEKKLSVMKKEGKSRQGEKPNRTGS
jgi:hypothetical protein